MKVSIITVCFNGARTIEDTIRSVLGQDYKDIEYIIIDGGSNDGTVEMIKSYGNKIPRWSSEPDRGIYDAMNKGIKMATGDVIGFLNADDMYFDADVLSHVAFAMRDSSVDACYSDLVYVDKNDTNKIVRYWRSRRFEPGLFKKGWVPAHPTFFVRKRIYDQHGGFDMNYKLAADFELMARLLEYHQIKAVYIPKIFIRMRVGGATNKSIANIVKQNLEINKACRNNKIKISPLSFLINKLITRLQQFYLRPAI